MQTRNRIFFAFVLLALVACSPVYKDFYKYHDLSSQNARYCANTCAGYKQNCESSVRYQYETCTQAAAANYQSCMAGQTYWTNPKNGKYECFTNCYCSQDSCDDPDLTGCEKDYVECYLNCGGTVTVTTSCVDNCKEAAPPFSRTLKRGGEEVKSKPKSSKK